MIENKHLIVRKSDQNFNYRMKDNYFFNCANTVEFMCIFKKILAHCRIVGSTSLSNCLLSSCLLSKCLLSSCLLSNCQGAPVLGTSVWGLRVGMTLRAGHYSNLLNFDCFLLLPGLSVPFWGLGVGMTCAYKLRKFTEFECLCCCFGWYLTKSRIIKITICCSSVGRFNSN